MTAVDYILIAVILLSIVFGAVRGFLRESIALLAWLVGLWVAWKYSGLLEPHLGGALANTALQVWVARGILLLRAMRGDGVQLPLRVGNRRSLQRGTSQTLDDQIRVPAVGRR